MGREYRMVEIHTTGVIERSAADVFAYVADYRRMNEWVFGITSVRPVGDADYGPGSGIRRRRRPGTEDAQFDRRNPRMATRPPDCSAVLGWLRFHSDSAPSTRSSRSNRPGFRVELRKLRRRCSAGIQQNHRTAPGPRGTTHHRQTVRDMHQSNTTTSPMPPHSKYDRNAAGRRDAGAWIGDEQLMDGLFMRSNSFHQSRGAADVTLGEPHQPALAREIC